MLKLRLRRTGAKKQPAYRLVVTESTAPRDGTFLEILGHYNPLTTPTTFEIKEERVREWLRIGAQPTERVARLLTGRGILSMTFPTAPAEPAAETAKAAEAPKPTPVAKREEARAPAAPSETPEPAEAAAPSETPEPAEAAEPAKTHESAEESA